MPRITELNDHIKTLLARYFAGTATAEELFELYVISVQHTEIWELYDNYLDKIIPPTLVWERFEREYQILPPMTKQHRRALLLFKRIKNRFFKPYTRTVW